MRLGEIKLHDLELIAGLVSIKHGDKYKYPGAEIQSLWEDLCLCQFHDVLPGSCIGMVYYDEAYPMLRKLLKQADKLILEALKVDVNSNTTSGGGVVNTLPWNRYNEIVEVSRKQSPELFEQLIKDKVGIRTQNHLNTNMMMMMMMKLLKFRLILLMEFVKLTKS